MPASSRKRAFILFILRVLFCAGDAQLAAGAGAEARLHRLPVGGKGSTRHERLHAPAKPPPCTRHAPTLSSSADAQASPCASRSSPPGTWMLRSSCSDERPEAFMRRRYSPASRRASASRICGTRAFSAKKKCAARSSASPGSRWAKKVRRVDLRKRLGAEASCNAVHIGRDRGVGRRQPCVAAAGVRQAEREPHGRKRRRDRKDLPCGQIEIHRAAAHAI